MTKSSSLILLAVFAIGLCSLTTSAATIKQQQDTALFYNIFKDWMSQYNKQYGIEEMAVRYYNWKNNYDLVQEHNAKGLSYKLEMNHFAAMTPEEFSALHLGLNLDLDRRNKDKKTNSNNKTENHHESAKSHNESTKSHNESTKSHNESTKSQNESTKSHNESTKNDTKSASHPTIPKSVDWRTEGAVTGVKNQGQCGGCWSFSASGALEGLHAIKNKKLTSFSEQQMIDCAGDYGNQGCEGGLMTSAFQYTHDHGIQPESTYEYTGEDDTCKQNSQRVAFRNAGYEEVTANDTSALKAAVASQPVSVGIEASSMTVQLFKSGVINSGCETDLDHGVLVVGYNNTSNGEGYWIVKNSWGPSWGLNGYFHIAMGSQNDGAGVCGINMMASYPTI